MKQAISAVLGVFIAFWTGAALAQTAWIQVEAQANLAQAQGRAEAYTQRLPDVNGFRLSTGWYAITLGPYTAEGAEARRRQLLAQGAIPPDSFIAFSGAYSQQFWPPGAATLGTPPVTPPPSDETDTAAAPAEEPAAPALPEEPPEETLAEARAAERQLTRQDRADLQIALQWFGFYTSSIDAAFGPGTRRAMQAWQTAQGYDPTGVLTTRQREELLGSYNAVFASIGLAPVEDETAGIALEMPLAMVAFDRYDPPFAHFDTVNDSGVKVLLISQRGGEAALLGLYDIMQTLEIVPLSGPRERTANRFTITGENDEVTSYTQAIVADGHVKGFTLIWPAGEDRRRDIVLDAMRKSFKPIEGRVLPEALGDGQLEQSIDLISGLRIRRPERSRSGFYVDRRGAVLTTAGAVEGCERVTIDEDYTATVAATDADLGVALLRAEDPLAPLDYARFKPGVPRLQSDIVLAGYAFEGVLSAPTLTFGTLAELNGLNGEEDLSRLALEAKTGDVGGPIFDNTGAVLGMLLPPADVDGKRLPEDVRFAAEAPALAAFLSNNGVAASASDSQAALAPEDLTRLAADVTVLVSCWN